MGETVGPALQEGLSAAGLGQWAFQGVTYDATVDGDDCLGLPGGAVATQYIEQAATQCPNTKVVLSGYSEGAMVAHNGVGYASASSKAKVVVSYPFLDRNTGWSESWSSAYSVSIGRCRLRRSLQRRTNRRISNLADQDILYHRR